MRENLSTSKGTRKHILASYLLLYTTNLMKALECNGQQVELTGENKNALNSFLRWEMTL
jgi:hypothetical protein